MKTQPLLGIRDQRPPSVCSQQDDRGGRPDPGPAAARDAEALEQLTEAGRAIDPAEISGDAGVGWSWRVGSVSEDPPPTATQASALPAQRSQMAVAGNRLSRSFGIMRSHWAQCPYVPASSRIRAAVSA